jgi:hypothetical protein
MLVISSVCEVGYGLAVLVWSLHLLDFAFLASCPCLRILVCILSRYKYHPTPTPKLNSPPPHTPRVPIHVSLLAIPLASSRFQCTIRISIQSSGSRCLVSLSVLSTSAPTPVCFHCNHHLASRTPSTACCTFGILLLSATTAPLTWHARLYFTPSHLLLCISSVPKISPSSLSRSPRRPYLAARFTLSLLPLSSVIARPPIQCRLGFCLQFWPTILVFTSFEPSSSYY